MLTPAAEDRPPRTDLSVYSADQLRLYLARRKLSTSGSKEPVKKRIRDNVHVAARSSPGRRRIDQDMDDAGERVREDVAPTSSWSACCDCDNPRRPVSAPGDIIPGHLIF